MTEHTIRLRGGWTVRDGGRQDANEQRMTLPIQWGPDIPKRMILTRAFGRPRLDADRETVVLRMDLVPGIVAIGLNGQPITTAATDTAHYEIRLGGLRERNILVLEVEMPDRWLERAAVAAEWGRISLVVQTVERG